ncbi:MAG: GTP cyclohydrolase I [Planctomycetaceae bacterium]|nr:GTP cyclohydrolase I [Planctomycetaceae bacterium]
MIDERVESGEGAVNPTARKISAEQMQRMEQYAAEIFTTLGLNLDTPATRDTPARYIRALIDITEGYDGDPKLVKVFDTECRGGPDCRLSQIIEGPIRFFSLCEHHALPFFGSVWVGYISHEHIIGISKLTRLIRLFSRRFGVQERLGQQIADTLNQILLPHGVAIFIQAHHLCVEMRGVKETPTITGTTYWRGNYESDAALRAEFLSMCTGR